MAEPWLKDSKGRATRSGDETWHDRKASLYYPVWRQRSARCSRDFDRGPSSSLRGQPRGARLRLVPPLRSCPQVASSCILTESLWASVFSVPCGSSSLLL